MRTQEHARSARVCTRKRSLGRPRATAGILERRGRAAHLLPGDAAGQAGGVGGRCGRRPGHRQGGPVCARGGVHRGHPVTGGWAGGCVCQVRGRAASCGVSVLTLQPLALAAAPALCTERARPACPRHPCAPHLTCRARPIQVPPRICPLTLGAPSLATQGGPAGYRLKWASKLWTDHDRSDMVVAGTAAGVAAAFRSPVGGVLFALVSRGGGRMPLCGLAPLSRSLACNGGEAGWGLHALAGWRCAACTCGFWHKQSTHPHAFTHAYACAPGGDDQLVAEEPDVEVLLHHSRCGCALCGPCWLQGPLDRPICKKVQRCACLPFTGRLEMPQHLF